MNDGILEHPAAVRNRGPILSVLKDWLYPGATVLELASGPGQHAEWFARALPEVRWQPSDISRVLRQSIAARIERAGLTNVAAPLDLDAAGDWPAGPWSMIVAINLVHIAPWEVTRQLVNNAAVALAAGEPPGVLFFYGPYRRAGAHTSPGNTAFDADLRSRGTGSGIRDLEALVDLAVVAGLQHAATLAMPANNLCVIFQAPAGAPARAPAGADTNVS